MLVNVDCLRIAAPHTRQPDALPLMHINNSILFITPFDKRSSAAKWCSAPAQPTKGQLHVTNPPLILLLSTYYCLSVNTLSNSDIAAKRTGAAFIISSSATAAGA